MAGCGETSPGQDWEIEIRKAVQYSDVIFVCLSNNAVIKEGYVQKELRLVIDVASEKPEDSIFIVPIRLDECKPPTSLLRLHYIDYFPFSKKDWAYSRLFESLILRASGLKN